MKGAVKNVAVMAVCSGLVLTGTSIMITIGGLVGYSLADQKSLQTLPVSTMMIGTMIAIIPASFWMRRVGRRAGFVTGALLGLMGATICSLAVYYRDFWLFCFGTSFLGMYNAFGQYYRFAGADVANEEFKSRAISLVMAGGLIAAFLGPGSTTWTKDLFDPITFLGSFASIIVLCLLAMALLSLVRIPKMSAEQRRETGRPITEIMAQPVFIVAALAAMVGYGVMSLVMTATPISMVVHGHPFEDASFVIGWHIFAMFAPSFFTGSLIHRFGVLRIIFVGAAFLSGSLALSLSDITLTHYWTALVALGLGWNFLFIGGTTLLTECYTEAEKAKTQAANDFMVFGTVAIASLTSGTLLHFFGWQGVNVGATPFIAVTVVATIWLAVKRRRTAGQAV